MSVVDLVERALVQDVHRSDEGIFFCVLSPTMNESLTECRKASGMLTKGLETGSEEPNNWIIVGRRCSKQSATQLLVTGGPVDWTGPKVRSNLD